MDPFLPWLTHTGQCVDSFHDNRGIMPGAIIRVRATMNNREVAPPFFVERETNDGGGQNRNHESRQGGITECIMQGREITFDRLQRNEEPL